MKKCLLFAFMTIMGLVCCHAQDFAQYKQNLDWQVYNYPQEKIHVMTDKPYYITGDTIWLRAFVVNAVNHQPVDASKFVYVELISPMNEVSMRIIHSHRLHHVHAEPGRAVLFQEEDEDHKLLCHQAQDRA